MSPLSDGAPVAAATADDIRRIEQHEIQAFDGHAAHEADAVGEQDGVDGVEAATGRAASPVACALTACAWPKRSALSSV